MFAARVVNDFRVQSAYIYVYIYIDTIMKKVNKIL